jgi:hypothetical protein
MEQGQVKLLIWSGFALMVLLWTAGAVAVTGLLHWGAGLVDSAHAVELGQAATSLSVPAWLARWFDIGTIHAALDGIVWTRDTMQQAWPWVGAALQWLVPVTWVLWCLGLALMLLLAGAAHALVRRLRPAIAPPATALS